MKSKNTCPGCGSKLKTKNLRGDTFPWKDYSFVDLNVDIVVSACEICDDEFLNSNDIDNIDTGIENSIREQTEIFIKTIKHVSGLSQKMLSKKIGVTEAYMSDLVGKKKTPSYQIFNLLKVLSNHPGAQKDLNCFKGNCEELVHQMGAITLKEKYVYVDDTELQQLGPGSSFRNIMHDVQETVH